MIIAQLSNSVNATEIMLDRQNALHQARREKAMMVVVAPLDTVEIHFDGRMWQWVHRFHSVGKLAGYSSENFGSAYEAACAAMQVAATIEGAAVSQQVHDVINAELTAEAIMEEADAKPGLNVEDSDDDWWLDDYTDADIAAEAMSDMYPRGI